MEASKRANLYDAPNVLRAVERALASGTPDEKGWAAEVFRECFGYWPNKKFDGLISPDAAVAALQQKAFASLIERCDGVYVTGWEDRKEMLAALRSAAESSTSVYGVLKALQQRHKVGDSRWQPAEANLLATALYGADALLRREALQVLVDAIDKNAPGGSDRYLVLGGIMHKEQIDNSLLTSDFERLQLCSFGGMCRGESTLPSYHFPNAEPEPEPGPAIQRLFALYQDALSRRLSPAEILAIR